jgi:FtsP/CotA-like multicopper oxidase with cupredoxin domain
MLTPEFWTKSGLVTRRQLIKYGLAGTGLVSAGLWWRTFNSLPQAKIPPIPADSPTMDNPFNPMQILRDFDYGTLTRENGRTVREFRLVANTSTLQLNSAVTFNSWNVNNRVPGPTLRAKAGERVRIAFLNQAGHAHSLHFHGVHRAEMDGVKPIRNGAATIYEFDAEPYGLHLYHCHIAPVTRHVGKGLYGLFIIDPPQARPPADEMVLVMGGYDVNEDGRNELYAFNGIPDYYMMNPISIYQHQLIRLYVLNMIEHDIGATFHLHANMFRVYPTGMTLQPSYETDVITMGTAERHILEFSFKYPGKYMFHPHQDGIAEHGCMGVFDVISA